MTVLQLKEWLASLPPEMDDANVCGTGGGGVPYAAKRIIAYGYKDGTEIGIVVNQMGSHLSDECFESMRIISTLDSDGKTHLPK